MFGGLSPWQATLARLFPRSHWPAYNKQYEFTRDWFSSRIPSWHKLLGEFKGRDGLEALEVGSYEGRSALWLLENILTGENDRLTCVDFIESDVVVPRLLRNLELSGCRNKITFLNEASSRALPTLKYESFDLIYIDGGHSADQTYQDAKNAWSLIKIGGLLIFDDYRWKSDRDESQQPRRGIDGFLATVPSKYKVVLKGYQLAIRRIV
jgi:predicted O-methyltransferase YrrM